MTLKEREYLVGHIKSLDNDMEQIIHIIISEKDENLKNGWRKVYDMKHQEKYITENILIYFSHKNQLNAILKAQNEKLETDEEYKKIMKIRREKQTAQVIKEHRYE